MTARTVAIVNQKGGVGKTTVTLGLAAAAMAAGRRLLVIDLDPQGSSSWVLGVEPESVGASITDVLAATPKRGLLAEAIVVSSWSDLIDVVPASPERNEYVDVPATRLARVLERSDVDLDAYEAILIDCPPSLGNLATNALAAARHALVVVEPSALGLRGIGGVADLIDEVWDAHNPDLELSGVILNRVPGVSVEAQRRIDELGRIVGKSAIWKPPIPQRVIFNQAVSERRPIHAYASRATHPIEAFDRLWAKLRRTITSGV